MRRSFNNTFEDYQGGYSEGDFADDVVGDANGGGGDLDGDSFFWNDSDSPANPLFKRNNSRRPRYGDAYGDYRGGYGPGGGFGPRPPMGPPRMLPPIGPPMPPPNFGPGSIMWGRGYGPGGPRGMGGPGPRGPGPRGPGGPGGSGGPRGPYRRSDLKAIKYLMKCGVTKDNLKNLPRDLLMLIQPEHCGLCDFGFETFAISRMHYISKNHLKNQKKWLAKTQGSQPLNETPLKARDLYCELCDIQITSKVHGKAHYDGKPHRGIVEGRKRPKNPLLIQSHMRQRLEQLIRREKRCLKAVTKESTEEVEEKPAEPPKAVSSELYCNICKTTVTCSEQMTMHMNGKKHLSKEKQHILNMMRDKTEGEGEGDYDDEEEEEGDGEGDGEEGGDEDEEQADGEGKHDDDWGNEAWDTQDQSQTAA